MFGETNGGRYIYTNMKQIIIIGGGNPFDTYGDYISYLKNKPIRFERFRMRDWKETLGEKLGKDFDVILPVMPCKDNAKYSEWKIWFERLIPFFEKELMFIGHSLGGIFLAKWLSENRYPGMIRAVFLVAAPFRLTGESQQHTDFALQNDLKQFEDQVKDIFIYHSQDDPIVDVSDVEKYQAVLPKAHTSILNGFKHLNQAEFPEIISGIRNLS